MLEYVKTILQKVSFDRNLFEKELQKSIRVYLQPHEVDTLQNWCYQQFKTSKELRNVLDKCFRFSYSV
ncbi:MAG: hypothetical protein EAZ55_04410 [Cytophagales bacterium]|nr:MAG: hypothetical protein EAZ55_04410 [Cytophagales bacterium]